MRVAAAVLAIAIVASGCASANSADAGRTVAAPSAPAGSGIAVGTASVATAAPARPGTPHPPAPTPVLGAGAVLTGADWNATVRLRVGQRVRVVLGGDQPFRWGRVRTSSTRIAGVFDALGGRPGLTVRAVVVARSPGRAWLTSTADAPCFHTRPPCLAAVRDWQVAVVVRP